MQRETLLKDDEYHKWQAKLLRPRGNITFFSSDREPSAFAVHARRSNLERVSEDRKQFEMRRLWLPLALQSDLSKSGVAALVVIERLKVNDSHETVEIYEPREILRARLRDFACIKYYDCGGTIHPKFSMH